MKKNLKKNPLIQILTTFDSYRDAHHLVGQLTAAGLAKELFSISNVGAEAKPTRRMEVAFAMVIGIIIAVIIPNHYLAPLSFGFPLIGLVGLRLLTGAATGGAIELLLQKTISSAPAAGRYAVAIEADWDAVQRAQQAWQDVSTCGSARLQKIVQTYGYEHQSFLSLYDGGDVWFLAEPDAAVVYRRLGRVALVTAAPLAAREHWAQATQAFLQFCAEQKLDCVMLPVSSEFAAVAQTCGMGILGVGTSGYFRLADWKPAGDRAKKVRAGVNQARGAGVTVKPFSVKDDLNAPIQAEIEQLCQEWLNSREVDALGWLLELNPFKLAEQKRYFLARNTAGQLLGMLTCSPFAARRGWYLEDLLRQPDAPRGVSELLVVEALKHLAAEGAELATLATAPLAGVKPEGQFNGLARLLQWVYEHGESFYHFKQLHRFKAKFAPSFVDTDYVAIWPPRVRLRMLSAALKVFDPNGLTGMATAKLRKLWQRAQSLVVKQNELGIGHGLQDEQDC